MHDVLAAWLACMYLKAPRTDSRQTVIACNCKMLTRFRIRGRRQNTLDKMSVIISRPGGFIRLLLKADQAVWNLQPKVPFTREQFSKGPMLNCNTVVKFYKMYIV